MKMVAGNYSVGIETIKDSDAVELVDIINKWRGKTNPYQQMAAGNHTIGVIKDGELIATDADVYMPLIVNPVAWRFCVQGMWFVAEKKETCINQLMKAEFPDGSVEIEPLYASPITKDVVRRLWESDPFCPNCGHDRDKSSVSSVEYEDRIHECQMCGTRWEEV